MNLILWGIVLLGIYVKQSVSQKVQCYSSFSISTGKCGDLLGEAEKKDCCMNSYYGYTNEDGKCMYCGLAAWTEWSSWGECSVSCTDGVTQRRRSCNGNGTCLDEANLGTVQTKPCKKKECCPEEGGWSEWGKWQPCSVTCENGKKKRQRTCTNPVPQCGGSCRGEQEELASCTTEVICPTHGGWSIWGSWGPCQSTCIDEGHNTQKELRKRTCTNPTPSTAPPGRHCDGLDTDTRPCSGLPFCPIDGNWGPWSGTTPCSVTCGLGRQTQRRLCNSPSPKHGGKNCRGEEQKTGICSTDIICPIHGIWSEWSQWLVCKFSSSRQSKCQRRPGNRRRERVCNFRSPKGNLCIGDIVEYGNCYNITDCELKGVLSEWSEWSYCKPDCGPGSEQTRERKCVPDISEYGSHDRSIFTGNPKVNCKDLKTEFDRKPCKNVPECKDEDDGAWSPE